MPPQPSTLNPQPSTPAAIVTRCEQVMSHAWMVRTFIKHSEEAEEFPELMHTARTVFDMARALETRLDEPAKYLHMLRKKLPRLAKAANQFRHDAAEASTHMNFRQAVASLDACVEELQRLVATGTATAAVVPTADAVAEEE